jgi:hypothetical protein
LLGCHGHRAQACRGCGSRHQQVPEADLDELRRVAKELDVDDARRATIQLLESRPMPISTPSSVAQTTAAMETLSVLRMATAKAQNAVEVMGIRLC